MDSPEVWLPVTTRPCFTRTGFLPLHSICAMARAFWRASGLPRGDSLTTTFLPGSDSTKVAVAHPVNAMDRIAAAVRNFIDYDPCRKC